MKINLKKTAVCLVSMVLAFSAYGQNKKIIGDAEPIDCRPADLLKPELDTIREECAEWVEQEEDVLSYAQFGQVAVKFFEKRRNKKYGVDGKHSDKEKQIHPV